MTATLPRQRPGRRHLRSPLVRRPLLLLVATLALAACTRSHTQVTTTRDTTVHNTVTSTRSTPRPAFVPKPATAVAPLTPGQSPSAGEVEKPCPYILSSFEQGPNSMADLEGDRVYRTTVLTATKPVGCRFYFWASPYEAISEITARTFPTSLEAHNAIVLTGQTGTQAEGRRDIVPGVDAVLFRTTFFGPDQARDWACVFAKGKIMVTVRTQRKDTSLNALLIAQAIAAKF
ncbi:MAG: hypothetical protein DLM57_08365 [Pseudonocardiales bacterium]|nr:MAG: hypothetical protein DLM57_08365 [Pseudonocardiales bacterium]